MKVVFEISSIEVIEKSPVFVRVDDLGTNDLPAIDIIINICKKNDIPLLLAVIPEQLSEETADYLKNEISKEWPGLIIAQHGVTHIPYVGHVKKMEFSLWEDVDQIIHKLEVGKKILFDRIGIDVTWYVPPWNKYGRNLVDALEKSGFESFSASTRLPFYSDKLANFPINQDIVVNKNTKEIEEDPVKLFSETKKMVRNNKRCGLMLHHHTLQEKHLKTLDQWATYVAAEFVQ